MFFDGANANAANGGRVGLYAPSTWNQGSSYSHLAESFNNSPNALMTFSLGFAESIHSPGPLTLALLRDLGWGLEQTDQSPRLLRPSRLRRGPTWPTHCRWPIISPTRPATS
ncbi:MAG TPA: hypothetical protein VFU22_29155 [Roseiflexaceae bacterium]|nr:hypothetical protein [Roseiflexaceae bacterium]